MKNRWKELEMVGTKKQIWVIISQIWAFLDILYFYAAFFQANKCLKFFTWLDHKELLEKKMRGS